MVGHNTVVMASNRINPGTEAYLSRIRDRLTGVPRLPREVLEGPAARSQTDLV
jgi:hypothetical protein